MDKINWYSLGREMSKNIRVYNQGYNVISKGLVEYILGLKIIDDITKLKIHIGFSDDLNIMYAKFNMTTGLKLGAIKNQPGCVRFTSRGIIKQFTKTILGRYEFKEYMVDQKLFILKKTINEKKDGV